MQPAGRKSKAERVKTDVLKPLYGVAQSLEAFREKVDPQFAASKERRALRDKGRQTDRRAKTKKLMLREIHGAEELEHADNDEQAQGRLLALDVENKERASGARKLTVYTKFWLINKTGLNLSYRMSPRGALAVPERLYRVAERAVGGVERIGGGRHRVAPAVRTNFGKQLLYPSAVSGRFSAMDGRGETTRNDRFNVGRSGLGEPHLARAGTSQTLDGVDEASVADVDEEEDVVEEDYTGSFTELMEEVRTPVMLSFPTYWNLSEGSLSTRVGDGNWSGDFSPLTTVSVISIAERNARSVPVDAVSRRRRSVSLWRRRRKRPSHHNILHGSGEAPSVGIDLVADLSADVSSNIHYVGVQIQSTAEWVYGRLSMGSAWGGHASLGGASSKGSSFGGVERESVSSDEIDPAPEGSHVARTAALPPSARTSLTSTTCSDGCASAVESGAFMESTSLPTLLESARVSSQDETTDEPHGVTPSSPIPVPQPASERLPSSRLGRGLYGLRHGSLFLLRASIVCIRRSKSGVQRWATRVASSRCVQYTLRGLTATSVRVRQRASFLALKFSKYYANAAAADLSHFQVSRISRDSFVSVAGRRVGLTAHQKQLLVLLCLFVIAIVLLSVGGNECTVLPELRTFVLVPGIALLLAAIWPLAEQAYHHDDEPRTRRRREEHLATNTPSMAIPGFSSWYDLIGWTRYFPMLLLMAIVYWTVWGVVAVLPIFAQAFQTPGVTNMTSDNVTNGSNATIVDLVGCTRSASNCTVTSIGTNSTDQVVVVLTCTHELYVVGFIMTIMLLLALPMTLVWLLRRCRQFGRDLEHDRLARLNNPRMFLTALHDIVVVSQRMPLSMGRTRVVNFMPRYVLVNETNLDLEIGQKAVELWLMVRKREADGTAEPMAWQWPSANHRKKMVIRAVAPKIATGPWQRRGSLYGGRGSCGNDRASCASSAATSGAGGDVDEIHGPKYESSMPFNLATADDQMDAFVVKSRPCKKQNVRVAATMEANGSTPPTYNFVVDQKMRHGVIFVHIRIAVSRDTNLFIMNDTGVSISVAQRTWRRFLGARIYKDSGHNSVNASAKHFTTPTGYTYAVKPRPWDRCTFDEVQPRTLEPYALDDPVGEQVLLIRSGPPVTDTLSSANTRGSWTATCSLDEAFQNIPVEPAKGHADPGITLTLEHVAGKIKVLRIENARDNRRRRQRGPLRLQKLKNTMHNQNPLGRLRGKPRDKKARDKADKGGTPARSLTLRARLQRHKLGATFEQSKLNQQRTSVVARAIERRDLGKLFHDAQNWDHKHELGVPSDALSHRNGERTRMRIRGEQWRKATMVLQGESTRASHASHASHGSHAASNDAPSVRSRYSTSRATSDDTEEATWPVDPAIVATEGTAATHLLFRAAEAFDSIVLAEETGAKDGGDDKGGYGSTLRLKVKLEGIGLSLVARLHDLMRLTIRTIELRHKDISGSKAPGSMTVLRVEYAQIDNQSLHASLPIVLAPVAGRIYDYSVDSAAPADDGRAGVAPASGLRWVRIGSAPLASERELVNASLSRTLIDKSDKGEALSFSQREWDAFGVSDLRVDQYVKAGRAYFTPATSNEAASEDPFFDVDDDGGHGGGRSTQMLDVKVKLVTGWEDLMHFKKVEFKLLPLTVQLEDAFYIEVPPPHPTPHPPTSTSLHLQSAPSPTPHPTQDLRWSRASPTLPSVTWHR